MQDASISFIYMYIYISIYLSHHYLQTEKAHTVFNKACVESGTPSSSISNLTPLPVKPSISFQTSSSSSFLFHFKKGAGSNLGDPAPHPFTHIYTQIGCTHTRAQETTMYMTESRSPSLLFYFSHWGGEGGTCRLSSLSTLVMQTRRQSL